MTDAGAARRTLQIEWRSVATKAVGAMPRDVGADAMRATRVAADAAAEYVLGMLDLPDVFVLEVRRVEVPGDPTLSIYRTVFMRGDQVQTEAFGTREMLQVFLLGLRTVLLSAGYGAIMLSWDIPDEWRGPPGYRWQIPRGGLASREVMQTDDVAVVS